MNSDGRSPVAQLAEHKYMNLTTYRRSGVAVTTPVWFVVAGDHLLIRTAAASGKVKRIRANPHVRIAPATRDGRALGPEVDATARLLDQGGQDGRRVSWKIDRRYPLGLPTRMYWAVRRQPWVIIDVAGIPTSRG